MLHSWPIDSSELEADALKMCALVASSGKSGFFRSQVCEDFMVALFGRSTRIPFFVGFVFMTGIELWMYWSNVSSSKNISVATISTNNGLRFCCSTFKRVLYWDST